MHLELFANCDFFNVTVYCKSYDAYVPIIGLQEEGYMERLVPCPSCLARRPSGIQSLAGIKMFELVDCAKNILQISSTSETVSTAMEVADDTDNVQTIVCDRCPVESAAVSLRQLVPELLLLDVPSSLHISLYDQVLLVTVLILGSYEF